MDNFRKILKNLPRKPARSRLEPYERLINELLRRGRSYREIARILAENCQIQVSISTIHDFVRLHAKAKQKAPRPKPPVLGNQSAGTSTARAAERGATNGERAEPALKDVYERIAALKQRPAVIQKPVDQFHYDPNEPLHMPTKTSSTEGGK